MHDFKAIQLRAIEATYNDLQGILDGLSLQDSTLAEVVHLRDLIIEMQYRLWDNFPEIHFKYKDGVKL